MTHDPKQWELKTERTLGEIIDSLKLLPEMRSEIAALREDVHIIKQGNAILRSNCVHHRQSFKKDILDLHNKHQRAQAALTAISTKVAAGAKDDQAIKTIWKTLTVIAGIVITIAGVVFATFELYYKTGGLNEQPNTTRNVDKTR